MPTSLRDGLNKKWAIAKLCLHMRMASNYYYQRNCAFEKAILNFLSILKLQNVRNRVENGCCLPLVKMNNSKISTILPLLLCCRLWLDFPTWGWPENSRMQRSPRSLPTYVQLLFRSFEAKPSRSWLKKISGRKKWPRVTSFLRSQVLTTTGDSTTQVWRIFFFKKILK